RSRNSGACRSSKSFFTANSVSRQASNSQTSEREVSMKRQLVTSMGSLSIVIAAALLAPAFAAEQPGAVPRLADGHPDLQGVWDYRTITPMQRPLELGTKEFFVSDEEAAAWERTKTPRRDRAAGALKTGGGPNHPGEAPSGPKAAAPPGGPGGGGGVAGGELPTASSGGTAATRS